MQLKVCQLHPVIAIHRSLCPTLLFISRISHGRKDVL
jgi:hypothetical protein